MAIANKIQGKTQLVLGVIILAAVTFTVFSATVPEITGGLQLFVSEASNATGGNGTTSLGSFPLLGFFTSGGLMYLLIGVIVVIAGITIIFNMLKAGGQGRR